MKFSVDEFQEEAMPSEGEVIPFELVSQLMKKFRQVFNNSIIRHQIKKLLSSLASKMTTYKFINVESI